MSRERLLEERKNFRKNRPYGFVGKPASCDDGSVDLKRWECRIPGPEKTAWEGGCYPVTMIFPDSYPNNPPECNFPAGFFHPNVYPSGKVCLSLLDNDAELGGQWAPSINIVQILVGIQELLRSPNVFSPAQAPACELLKKNPKAYETKIKEQAKKYPAPEDED
ncbi:hypothetical protein HXX76_002988 [Chlamydomonas incerta]|uniref:UBC core domain-containing protein n=1 Tax=Chlamydomonas incerta TaxID=51695 RepID=A0A835TCF5_CHLIN|nr:hypothetical protein HXX76_002988 [Chlamydomonas incerta]|eukprot:KAG2442912.1 hypothetical protein HXX76_002988 [Chlamydomonas incerta]